MAHINPEKVLSDVKKGVAQMKTADAMRGGMMSPMMGEGMMGPMMMGNMMSDGMMDSMMGPMMRGMMGGRMAAEGMNMASNAPKARMLTNPTFAIRPEFLLGGAIFIPALDHNRLFSLTAGQQIWPKAACSADLGC